MKKFLSIFLILVLSFSVLLTGCDNTKVASEHKTTNNLGNNEENEIEQHEENKNTQVATGTYVCEYEDYIFYRNTNDNGSLYRYNIKDDSYIRLFDENAFPFLHTIKVFDSKVYFVTRTETDTSPTLYRVPVNGGEAERLIENVCEDYAITEEAIYYTGFKCPCHYGADYLLHKYTFADKKGKVLVDDKKCYKQFNLKGDKIYCLTTNSDYSAYELSCFDIATETATTIDTGEVKNDFQYAVSANNGKIIYLTFIDTLYLYNIETNEFKEITKNSKDVHPNVLVLYTTIKTYKWDTK